MVKGCCCGVEGCIVVLDVLLMMLYQFQVCVVVVQSGDLLWEGWVDIDYQIVVGVEFFQCQVV